jgi:hypothetical protein
MANDSKSGENRNRRRRYFRRGSEQSSLGDVAASAPSAPVQKPAPAQKPTTEQKARPRSESRGGQKSSQQPPLQPAQDRRKGTASRRRRRNKSRSQSTTPRTDQLNTFVELDTSYSAPNAVFIYTHVIRPDTRESYEFRSERFSNVGRTLEEFDIDVSELFKEPESLGARIATAFASMSPDEDSDDETELY